MCPVLLNGLQCIDNYTRRCLTLKHREYFNKLYAGTIRVIKDLCNTKGRYQQEYIRHAPCMRQVNPKYNQCSEVYHQKTAGLNQVDDAAVQLSEEQKNKNVITLCCSFQEYLQCSERVVYETCGNETALFTKEFLDRMAGPIVQDLCQAFSFSLHSCLQESSTASPGISPQAAVFFLNKASSWSGQETRNSSVDSSHTVESLSRDSSHHTAESNALVLSSNPQEDHRPYFKSSLRQSLQSKTGQALMNSRTKLDPTNEPLPTLVFTHGTTVRPPTLPPLPPISPTSSDASPVNADTTTTFRSLTQKSKTQTLYSKKILIKEADSSSSAMVELPVITSPVIHSTHHRLKTRDLHDKEEQNLSTNIEQFIVHPVPLGSDDVQHEHEKFDNTTNLNASHSAALLQDQLLTSLVKLVNNASSLSTEQADSSVLTQISESSHLNAENSASLSFSTSFLPNSSISPPSFSYKRRRPPSGVAKYRRLMNLHRPEAVKNHELEFINTTTRYPPRIPVTGGSTTVANDEREKHITLETDHPHSLGSSRNMTLLPRRRPRIRHSWRHFHPRSGRQRSRWQTKPNFVSQESFRRNSQNMTITTGKDERFVKERPNHRPKWPVRRRPLPEAHWSNSTETPVEEDEAHLQYQHGNESEYANGTSESAIVEPKLKQEIEHLKTASNESMKVASHPEVLKSASHPKPGTRDFSTNGTIFFRQAGNGINSNKFPRKLGKRGPYQNRRPLQNRQWHSRFLRRRKNGRGKTPSRQREEISSDSIGIPEEAHMDKINTHQPHNGAEQVTSRTISTTEFQEESVQTNFSVILPTSESNKNSSKTRMSESPDGPVTITESPSYGHVTTITQSTSEGYTTPNIGSYLDKAEKTRVRGIAAEGDTTMVETVKPDKVTENNKSIVTFENNDDNDESYDEYHYSDHDIDGFEEHHTEKNSNCHTAKKQGIKHDDSNFVNADNRSVIFDPATPKASHEHDKFKLLNMTQLSNTSGTSEHDKNDVKYYKGGYNCNTHEVHTSVSKTSNSHGTDNERELHNMDDKIVLRPKQFTRPNEDDFVEVRATEDGLLIGSGENGSIIGSGENELLIESGEISDTLPTSSAEVFYLWFRNRLEEEVKEAVIPAPTPVPYVIQLRKEQETKDRPSANFDPVILDILESDFIPLVNPGPRNIDNGEHPDDINRLKIDMPANEYVSSHAKTGNTKDEAHLQTLKDLTPHTTSSEKSKQTMQVGQPDTLTSNNSEDGIRNMEENLTRKQKSKHSEHVINRETKIKSEEGTKKILDEATAFSLKDALRLEPSSHIPGETISQSPVLTNDTDTHTNLTTISSNTKIDEWMETHKGQTAGEVARAKFPAVLPTHVTGGTSTRIITNFTRRPNSTYNETTGVIQTFSTPDDTQTAAGAGSRDTGQQHTTEEQLLHTDERNLTEILESNTRDKAATVESNLTSTEDVQVVRDDHQGEWDQVTSGSHPSSAATITFSLFKMIILSVFCMWVIL
ncbi:serine-rich adhesin for platelets [Procambarus clarkii]|uniref:serine-rich adhesin for platelets n=1 Tax=Procambarus clarkii TaxID=6728 RepID=UPI0037438E0B